MNFFEFSVLFLIEKNYSSSKTIINKFISNRSNYIAEIDIQNILPKILNPKPKKKTNMILLLGIPTVEQLFFFFDNFRRAFKENTLKNYYIV